MHFVKTSVALRIRLIIQDHSRCICVNPKTHPHRRIENKLPAKVMGCLRRPLTFTNVIARSQSPSDEANRSPFVRAQRVPPYPAPTKSNPFPDSPWLSLRGAPKGRRGNPLGISGMTVLWVLLRYAVKGIASSLRRLAPRNDTAGDVKPNGIG